MILFFIKRSIPLLAHFTIVFYLVYTQNLNRLEFLGLNFSLGFTVHFLNQIFKFIYDTWIGIFLKHNVNLKDMGSWALVTGATDGIGLAYSRELAKRGLNLVLMSRSLDRLEKLAKSLEKEFGVDTKIIDVDFSQGVEIYKRIDKLLSGMEIGTLINNVGMSYTTPENFHRLPEQTKFIHDMININVLTATMMIKVLLPGMIERRKGVVVNVGSIASILDLPWFSLYCASKAFMDKLTTTLANEYRDKGIHFQYLLPGYVTTKLSKIREPSFWVPDPEKFVQMAVDSIGLQDRSAIWIPHRTVSMIYNWIRLFFPNSCDITATEVMKSFWLFAKKREMQKFYNPVDQ